MYWSSEDLKNLFEFDKFSTLRIWIKGYSVCIKRVIFTSSTLHQFVKVIDALGFVNDGVNVQIKAARFHTSAGNILFDAALRDVVSSCDVPDSDANRLRPTSECVFCMAEVIALIRLCDLVNSQPHNILGFHLEIKKINVLRIDSPKLRDWVPNSYLLTLITFVLTSLLGCTWMLYFPPWITGTRPFWSLQNSIFGSGYASTLHSNTTESPKAATVITEAVTCGTSTKIEKF